MKLTVRSSFLYILGLTCLASAVALLDALPASGQDAERVRHSQQRYVPNVIAGQSRSLSDRDPALFEGLPSEILRGFSGPVQRDLFSRRTAVHIKAAAVVSNDSPPVAPVEITAEPEAPPPMRWRFLGGVRGPDGSTFVYLGDGEEVRPVQAGTDLPDGYQVEEVVLNSASQLEELSVSEVRLVYAALGQRQILRVSEPEAP